MVSISKTEGRGGGGGGGGGKFYTSCAKYSMLCGDLVCLPYVPRVNVSWAVM